MAESFDKRLHSLLKHIPGAIYRSGRGIAKDRELSYTTDGIEAITGYRAQDIIGGDILSYGQLIYPDDLESVERTICDSLHNDTPYSIEYRIRNAAGNIRWVYESGHVTYNEHAHAESLEGIILDITEFKRMEFALAESEKRFQLLVETTESIILYLSTQGDILEINPAAEELYGVRREDVIGKNYIEHFLPEEARGPVLNDIKKVLSGTPTRGFENPVVANDGSTRVLSWYVKRILGEDACPIGIVASGHDITERIEAEKALFESERMLQLVLDSIPVRVYWRDRNLVYMGSNSLFAKDVRVESPLHLKGKTDADLEGFGQSSFHEEDDREVVRTGKPNLNKEVLAYTPEGKVCWFKYNKIPLTDINDNIVGILGTYEDITGRREAEQKAADRNLRLSAWRS